jgi:hypothetical protein
MNRKRHDKGISDAVSAALLRLRRMWHDYARNDFDLLVFQLLCYLGFKVAQAIGA